jgi:hypothetical protein
MTFPVMCLTSRQHQARMLLSYSPTLLQLHSKATISLSNFSFSMRENSENGPQSIGGSSPPPIPPRLSSFVMLSNLNILLIVQLDDDNSGIGLTYFCTVRKSKGTIVTKTKREARHAFKCVGRLVAG